MLVIGPKFFTMMDEIVAKINEQGVYCKFWDERISNKTIIKIIYRLRLDSFIFFQKRRYFSKLRDFIKKEKFNIIYLVDVESFSRREIEEIKSITSIQHIYFYTWDSVKNKSKFLKYRDLLSGCSTFDPEDAKQYNLNYIGLYANSLFQNNNKSINRSGIFVCSTLHSSRPFFINSVIFKCAELGIPLKLFLYYHSKLLFYIRAIFSYNWFLLRLKTRFSVFNIMQIADQSFKAKFILDIAHPNQSGLTARSYEALRSGAYLLTNNKNAKLLLPTLSSRILEFSSANDLISIIENLYNYETLKPLNKNLDYEMSIERFIFQLLEQLP